MSKRFVMFCIAALVLALAMPAYAEVQNVKVSGDIEIMSVSRNNFGLQKASSPLVITQGGTADNQNAFLTITRLRVDAELTDNVSVVLRLLNERDWDVETDSQGAGNNTGMNLDLSYVVLKEFLYSPLTLTAGRQELHFGNDLIIGDVDTNSMAIGNLGTGGAVADYADLSARKSFDAVRGTLDYIVADQPLVVDVVYAKIAENTNNRNDDVNLYGFNANYPVNDDILTELYLWTRDRLPNSVATNGASTPALNEQKTERLQTLGARGVYTGVDNLTLQSELAWQFGNKLMDSATVANLLAQDTDTGTSTGARLEDSYVKVNAWALQLMGSYVFEDVRHSPVLGVSYTHLSGEKSDSTQAWNGWDGMYENQGGGTIWNKIVGFSNCDLINVNASFKPDFVDDLTVLANWYNIQLVEPLDVVGDNAYILSGIPGGQTYKVGNSKDLGNEIDLALIYDYTEDVQLGLNVGMFIPGDTFNSDDNDSTASQAIASMKVTF